MSRLTGLTEIQVSASRQQSGLNVIVGKKRLSAFTLLLSQFVSPMMGVLIVAGVISYFLHGVGDALVVWGAVILNGLLGFYQEYHAEKSLQELEKIVEVSVEVMRKGQRTRIPLAEIVVGDICYLKSGDRVPGDATVLEADVLSTNEAMLTGESSAVIKAVKGDNQVYMGTSVMSGLGVIKIVRVGNKTRMGQIAQSLTTTTRTPTKLQVELARFAKILTWVVVGVATLLFLVGISRGMATREMFLVSVAVAVSAIPEGLAVTLTVILSIGMQKLLRKRGLVRKLLVAEALGKVSMVCADKTGTLTKGEMSVVKTIGEVQKLAEAGVLGDDKADAIETAVSVWATSKCKMMGWARIATIPFESHKKYGASVSTNQTETRFVLRGAPEVVMQHCQLTEAKTRNWIAQIAKLGSQGYRIIGVAEYRTQNIPPNPERELRELIQNKSWQYLGIMVMEDPIRPDVADDIKRLRELGIKFCVITGDFAQTAEYVMKKLGIEVGGKTITGSEFVALGAPDQEKVVKDTILYARFAPGEKLRVVEILKNQGEVVAMMGDGINDAPALKRADVGVVVNSASEVAKETADMILLNNKFSTVIAGIEEGRSIFERIRRVVRYLLSDSFSEVILVSIAIFIGLPLPVTAAQILWVNLANDTFPAMALAFDPINPGKMNKKRGNAQRFWDSQSKLLVSVVSIVSGLLVIAMFSFALAQSQDIAYARSLAFTFLGMNTLFCVFVIRDFEKPIWQTKFFDNSYLLGGVTLGMLMQMAAIYFAPLQRMLGTVPLLINDWLVILAGTIVVILSIEIAKLVLLKLVQQPNTQVEQTGKTDPSDVGVEQVS